MKNITKVICLVLALVFVAAFLPSCAESGDGTETTTGSSGNNTGAETTAGKYNIGNNLPADLSFQGEEIRIISRDLAVVADEITAEADGAIVNDAIYSRNLTVEARLGVTIDNYQMGGTDAYAISNVLRNLVSAEAGSNSQNYDVVANSTYSTIMYVNEGIMRNLTDVEYLDLSRPYWSQSFNEAASVEDRQYMATGAMALSTIRYAFVTMYNKTLASTNANIENLYDVVREKRWTLDYQFDLAEQFYADIDAEPGKSQGDRFGFVTCTMLYVDPYWQGCNNRILTKDAENRYVINIDSTASLSRLSTTLDKVLRLYYNTDGTYVFISNGDQTNENNISKVFADGRALTASLRLSACEGDQMRNMTDLYTILPIPKFDVAQENYGTYVHDQVTGIGILSGIDESRVSMVGAFLECMASTSYEKVIPEYYEYALKNRYLQEPEAAEMLDLVYNSISFDGGILYTKSLSSIHQKIRDIVASKTNTTSSSYDKLTLRALSAQVDKLMTNMLALAK